MECVQLIDENKQFTSQLSKYLEVQHINDVGLDYHVVSVFGSQSTGKSTLLNALFKTHFQVMDETKRAQTTKGIWLARAEIECGNDSEEDNGEFVKVPPGSSNAGQQNKKTREVMVLDVEGTDGRERGEDQDFERRSALFALATSEALIVNMWENQVGLYQGANMGLLKTVFEVNLSLFQSSHQTNRSLILFVIRDHLGTTPLENLANTLMQDLNKHWDSISKPSEELRNCKIQDFFDIDFYALPHKVLLPEKFDLGVANLAKRFSDAEADNYIFKPEYHRKVPIDGWPMYASQVWEQIELNKDLDLPTQQMLVARFRCEEIANEAWIRFEDDVRRYEQLGAFQSSVADFGSQIGGTRTQALTHYDELASRYEKSVYLGKRKELLSRIDTKVLTLYKAQLLALHREAIEHFNTNTVNPEDGMTFADMLETARTNALVHFVEGCKEATVDEQVFSYAEQLGLLNTELDECERAKQISQIDAIVNRASKRISRVFAEELDSLFRDPNSKTWDQVEEFFNHTFDTVMQPYESGHNFKVGADTATNLKGRQKIRKAAWIALDSRLSDITRVENVVARLRDIFERQFKYDRNDVPIVWKASDDIQTPYLKARDQTIEFVGIFARAKLSNGELLEPDVSLDEDFEGSDFAIRLSESKKEEVIQKFKRQADAMYIEAKRSTAMVATKVPFYVIVIIILLGWNELMMVLRNPLLILFSLMILGSAYITYSLDLWGPMMSVGGAMTTRAVEVGKEWLRDALEVSNNGQPQQAQRVSSHREEIVELEEIKQRDDSD